MGVPENKGPRRIWTDVLTSFTSGQRLKPTNSLCSCQQKTEYAFKQVYCLYVINRQQIGRSPFFRSNTYNTQDKVGPVLDSISNLFKAPPFSVGYTRAPATTFALLNHTHDAATCRDSTRRPEVTGGDKARTRLDTTHRTGA
jgi:hypothetical protein